MVSRRSRQTVYSVHYNECRLSVSEVSRYFLASDRSVNGCQPVARRTVLLRCYTRKTQSRPPCLRPVSTTIHLILRVCAWDTAVWTQWRWRIPRLRLTSETAVVTGVCRRSYGTIENGLHLCMVKDWNRSPAQPTLHRLQDAMTAYKYWGCKSTGIRRSATYSRTRRKAKARQPPSYTWSRLAVPNLSVLWHYMSENVILSNTAWQMHSK